MRSFQVCTCGQPLQCNEYPTPKPTGTEVLLKVLAAGVCHSDLHLADGYFDLGGGKRMSLEDRGMKLPVTLGHENVGEVVAVGPQAEGEAEYVLCLPLNPDQTCQTLRERLHSDTGADVGVIINDSHGRAWRFAARMRVAASGERSR